MDSQIVNVKWSYVSDKMMTCICAWWLPIKELLNMDFCLGEAVKENKLDVNLFCLAALCTRTNVASGEVRAFGH